MVDARGLENEKKTEYFCCGIFQTFVEVQQYNKAHEPIPSLNQLVARKTEISDALKYDSRLVTSFHNLVL